ncbi:MAG TPA: DUF2071 domain-containing protein [Bacteroidia bacterium]|nr:DUF2071 domain-containing protein [Bacteroidia bacterium]
MLHKDPDLILQETSHRPYPPPDKPWAFYQEWKKVLFLHWAVNPDELLKHIPAGLELELVNGKAYISIVAFLSLRSHPHFLPAIEAISDFTEINVRTYVTDGKKNGIHFIYMETDKLVPTLFSKLLAQLPYEQGHVEYLENGGQKEYNWKSNKENYITSANFTTGKIIENKSVMDAWLTERYSNYEEIAGGLYRYPVHHQSWPLQEININSLKVDYTLGKIHLTENNLEGYHYSDGVNVLGWFMEKM